MKQGAGSIVAGGEGQQRSVGPQFLHIGTQAEERTFFPLGLIQSLDRIVRCMVIGTKFQRNLVTCLKLLRGCNLNAEPLTSAFLTQEAALPSLPSLRREKLVFLIARQYRLLFTFSSISYYDNVFLELDDIILEIEDVYSLQRLHMQASCHNQGKLLTSFMISSLLCR